MSESGSGKVAAVTGAGSGIGRATAVMLGERGWRVVLSGRREAPLRETATLVEQAGGRAACVAMDVADEGGRRALIAEIERAFGRLDALINNAGYARLEPFTQMSEQTQRDIFAVNVEAPISLTRAAWGLLSKSGGRVVNVSSVAAASPFPGLGVYGAAKAALNLATIVMAAEGESVGVRAFSVGPGATETAMLRSAFDESVVGRDQTMAPEDVARVIVACAVGERDEDSGATIYLPGVGEGERVVRPAI
ncbi:MAG: SDR family oxidoreductase [Phycisphaerales bacterium]